MSAKSDARLKAVKEALRTHLTTGTRGRLRGELHSLTDKKPRAPHAPVDPAVTDANRAAGMKYDPALAQSDVQSQRIPNWYDKMQEQIKGYDKGTSDAFDAAIGGAKQDTAQIVQQTPANISPLTDATANRAEITGNKADPTAISNAILAAGNVAGNGNNIAAILGGQKANQTAFAGTRQSNIAQQGVQDQKNEGARKSGLLIEKGQYRQQTLSDRRAADSKSALESAALGIKTQTLAEKTAQDRRTAAETKRNHKANEQNTADSNKTAQDKANKKTDKAAKPHIPKDKAIHYRNEVYPQAQALLRAVRDAPKKKGEAPYGIGYVNSIAAANNIPYDLVYAAYFAIDPHFGGVNKRVRSLVWKNYGFHIPLAKSK